MCSIRLIIINNKHIFTILCCNCSVQLIFSFQRDYCYFQRIKEGGRLILFGNTSWRLWKGERLQELNVSIVAYLSALKLADLGVILKNVPPNNPKLVIHIYFPLKWSMTNLIFNLKSVSVVLDAQIARLFYACNLPFSLVEHYVFRQTIAMLRPGYAPPTRNKLAGQLLEYIYDEITEASASVLEEKNVTLILDGWSDIHNSPIIAHSVHTGKNLTLWVPWTQAQMRKQPLILLHWLLKIPKRPLQSLDARLLLLWATMREKFCQCALSWNPKSIHLQYMVLLPYVKPSRKDVTPLQVISQIIEINKYFRNHHVTGSLLSSKKDQLSRIYSCYSLE